MNRRFLPALIVSLLAHAGVTWWIFQPPQRIATPVRLEVTLTAPPVVPDEPAEDTVVGADAAVQPPAATAAPEPPETIQPAEPEREPEVVLNLDRPADWDQLIEPEPDSRPGGSLPVLPFNAALEAALGIALAEKRRRLLVLERRSALYGVDDEAYTREGPRGTEMKRDGQCITLVEDGAEPGIRWWAGTCTETRATPMTLPPVEYDRLGRVVTD